MDGDWTTPDLVPLVRLMLRNRRVLDGQSRLAGALHRLAGGIARRLRDNSLAGSRRHIHRHYDLGNEFFRLFLDAELLMYSCGYFESAADSLEKAQARKVDRICRTLRLSPGRPRARDRQRVGRVRRVGGDALWLPRDDHDDQRRAVPPRLRVAVADRRGRVAHRGAARRLPGADRAVRQGRQHRDVRGGRSQPLRRLLHGRRSAARAGRRRCSCRPSRSTISGSRSTTARRTGSRSTSFPAANWRRSARCCKSLARTTSLSMYHAENFGTHYARTLRAWRARFHQNLDARARARVRRPVHPHVGPVSRVVRSDVPRTAHRAVPVAAAEERRPARPLQRAVVRHRQRAACGGRQRVGGLNVERHGTC